MSSLNVLSVPKSSLLCREFSIEYLFYPPLQTLVLCCSRWKNLCRASEFFSSPPKSRHSIWADCRQGSSSHCNLLKASKKLFMYKFHSVDRKLDVETPSTARHLIFSCMVSQSLHNAWTLFAGFTLTGIAGPWDDDVCLLPNRCCNAKIILA